MSERLVRSERADSADLLHCHAARTSVPAPGSMLRRCCQSARRRSVRRGRVRTADGIRRCRHRKRSVQERLPAAVFRAAPRRAGRGLRPGRIRCIRRCGRIYGPACLKMRRQPEHQQTAAPEDEACWQRTGAIL